VRRAAAAALAAGGLLLAGCGHGSSSPPTVSTASDTGSTSTLSIPPPLTGGSRGAPDWLRFGVDAARSGVFRGPARITVRTVGSARRQRIELPGTVDSSPIYLRGAEIGGARHDVFVVTTTYGRTIALDADSGRPLWVFTPAGFEGWAGSSQITTSTPLASPDRRFVYSVSPDGRIHALRLADGRELETGGWPVSVTLDPTHEKIAPALNLSRGLLLVATGGYIGDAPPYQGHVVAIDVRSGRLVNVFNTLCSDRRGLIDPPSCSASGSAIWARSGVVVEPGSGRLLVATGNAAWNGRTNWGDSVLELSPDGGRLLQAYTPTNQAELEAGDVDLGSTAPALLGHGLAVQGGKDGLLRLLDLRRLNGRGGAIPRTGGELQTIAAPGDGGVFTAPAVWREGGRTWLFVGTSSGTGAYRLVLGSRPRLESVWENDRPGTSPVVAGGLLYVYDPGGALNVYPTSSREPVATLPAGLGHWNSPIVADGRIALPEGDSNDHALIGVLDVYRVTPPEA